MASRAIEIRHAINWEMVLLWGALFSLGALELIFAVYGFVCAVRVFLERLESLL